MKMDRIVVVSDGKIAAEGSHEELLKQGGLYQRLWSIQAGGFITDQEEAETEDEVDLEEIVEEEDDEGVDGGEMGSK